MALAVFTLHFSLFTGRGTRDEKQEPRTATCGTSRLKDGSWVTRLQSEAKCSVSIPLRLEDGTPYPQPANSAPENKNAA